MEKNDCLIFDLDGTLWSMNHVYLATWRSVLPNYVPDVRLEQEDIDRVIGLDFDTALSRMLPGVHIAQKDRLASDAFAIQHRLLRQYPPNLYSGVDAGLPALARNYQLFIVSNCDAETIPIFFERTGFDKFFTDWRSHGQSGCSKDQNLLNLRSEYNLKQPVYIGDTITDYELSKKAGMDFWQVWYGFGKPIPEVRGFSSFEELVAYCL